MVATATLPSRDIQATLNYYAPIGADAPFRYADSYDLPSDALRTNIGTDPRPAVVHNARGKEHELNLDSAGFQFVKHVSKEKEFLDDEKIKNEYYKEVEELLKKEVGAKRVFIFDHTIRRKPGTLTASGKPARGPGERVHIDQTFDASIARVHHHLGDEAPRLLAGRVRIINVWRPIGHPVAHKPLAVSDWRSLDVENDLVPSKLIYPDRVGSTYSVKYDPNLRWYYLPDQTPEEVILIKCYDSEVDRARLTPHTAFHDETSPKEAPHRESIEIRALVFDTE